MNQIKIEKSAGKNALLEIREDWENLFRQTNCAPFLSFEWIAAWYEKLAENREIYLLKAVENEQVIGILPLCLHTKKIFGFKFSRLGFLGEEIGGADYLDLIASEENKAEIWEKAFEFLREEKDFDSINLENLAQNSASVSILENLCEIDKSFRFKSIISSICPQIDLKSDWENVLSQSKRKDNFKRRLKKLEKVGGFEFRSITEKTEISAAFERFAFLHEKRWEKDGGSEATGLPQLMDFHRAVVEDLSEKNLVRFDEIWAEGECRASVYGLDNGETFYYYNAGYDLEWANMSVGMVLIGLSIKAAICRGNKTYDFLRGEETYKFDWSNSQENLVTIKLNRPNFLASANQFFEDSWTFLRDAAKNLLPGEFAAKLQNLKRNWLRNRKAN
ncbi:MAG TPA: GNAT family N-acetyltransferase [Pyrinomonadaceae bacterium]|nr:GNAT family N-acetyltransferase [Pyrinomonadaceae bacterium]